MTFPPSLEPPLADLSTQEGPVSGQFLRRVKQQMPHRTRAPPSETQVPSVALNTFAPTGPMSIDTMRDRAHLCAARPPGCRKWYPSNRYTFRPHRYVARDSTRRNRTTTVLAEPNGGEYA
jgi:hypothetical protein